MIKSKYNVIVQENDVHTSMVTIYQTIPSWLGSGTAQKNRIFDLKSTFQDSIYQNNIHNCQYFEEIELSNKLKSLETNQFSILSLNIQSLPGEEFKTFLAATFNHFKPSVIALQEIWNKPQNLEFILENCHPLHFRIRDKQGLNNNSGCIFLFSFYFEPAECISIFIPRDFECQFIKIKTDKNKYILVGNIQGVPKNMGIQ